jgi:hypothetical protein
MLQSFTEIKEFRECSQLNDRFKNLFIEIIFTLKEQTQKIKLAFHLLRLMIDGQGNASDFIALELAIKDRQK